MRSEIKIIITLVVALLAAVFVGGALYTHRVDEWRQVAGRTLKSAVSEEVVKRTGQPFYVATDGVHKPLEAREFPNERFVHTYWFQEQPLDADTLGRAWNDSLRAVGFRGKGLLRINAMDVETGQGSTTYWTDSVALAKADSLSYLSIGYVCETEITGYLSCLWWRVYAFSDWGILLSVGIGTFFCLMWLTRRRTISRLRPAMDVADGCCCLRDGTVFDKERHILRKGKEEVELTAMIARLMTVLVEAEGEEVASELLIEKVWPSHSGSKEQLRKAIERLRKLLHGIASEVVIENRWGTYRLK